MRKWLSWALLFLPAVIGLLLGGALETGLLPYALFVLRFQISAGVRAILIGVVTTGVASIGWGANRRWHVAIQRAKSGERHAQGKRTGALSAGSTTS